MNIQEAIKELDGFDINDLDFENMGSWPVIVKGVVLLIVFAAGITLGFVYDISELQDDLVVVEKKEGELRNEYAFKARQAANLEAYRKQMVEMEESFGALVRQLPSDTEVPGLLDDITNKGRENGLEISSTTFQAERSLEFYIELPISIVVVGTYHDIAAFVSGVAGLSRIVTLHDFSLKSLGDGKIEMKITAKTYRYKDEV